MSSLKNAIIIILLVKLSFLAKSFYILVVESFYLIFAIKVAVTVRTE